ncbi:protein kintoun [Latimeria chalumnae]|uniref:protein kintoun n=1 Tax=Latimeria chalumnae TaxID=7897 RepID=UPI0003C13054|nr:PREDICTED: protein kintoun [Latimeria chalumnae]|eukprot:XP_005995036.1 PREDICTED: protein kintoun [Latimeria chalumnae]
MAASSKLEDLNLTCEEVKRFSEAFKDQKFRELLVEYAEEISNPENKRKYEEEITLLEKERGMDIKFVHPQPGYVLKTSVDGTQKSFINICSNDLIDKPACQSGRGDGGRKGQFWSLPYSLAPGREDLGKDGKKNMIYDVVFNPDTLYMASKNEKFKKMVSSTAFEAVQKQFHVKLDEKNAKTLKIKYKGVPHPAVIRKPIPGVERTSQVEEADKPLKFPYPYDTPNVGEVTKKTESKREVASKGLTETQADQPTEPKFSIKYRTYFDLQDYRYARESAPNTRPKELVITIDLPLLNSAGDAELDVLEKRLILESKKPAYKLDLNLPYLVDENLGSATFNKTKRQLVVTLPVLSLKQETVVAEEPTEKESNDKESVQKEQSPGDKDEAALSAISQDIQIDGNEGLAKFEGSSAPVCHERLLQRSREIVKESSSDLLESNPESRQRTEKNEITKTEYRNHNGDVSGTEANPPQPKECEVLEEKSDSLKVNCMEPVCNLADNLKLALEDNKDEVEHVCPLFHCDQDETNVTLVLYVKNIAKESLKTSVGPHNYSVSLKSKSCDTVYSLFIHFPPECMLNGNALNVSQENAVVVLTKARESIGFWKKFNFGAKNDSLQERLFLSEENINSVLESGLSAVHSESTPNISPMPEVVEVCNKNLLIRLKPKHETDASYQIIQRDEKHCEDTENAKSESDSKASTTVEGNALSCDWTEAQSTKENVTTTLVTPAEEQSTVNKTSYEMATFTQKELEQMNTSCISAGEIQRAGLKTEFATADNTDISTSGEKQVSCCLKKQVKINDGDKLDEEQKEEPDGLLCNKAVVPLVVKKNNSNDGGVKIIVDHTTRSAFSFQNSMLYELD